MNNYYAKIIDNIIVQVYAAEVPADEITDHLITRDTFELYSGPCYAIFADDGTIFLGETISYDKLPEWGTSTESDNIEDNIEEEYIPEPTQLDRIEAQLVYTAMCTNTLLDFNSAKEE